MANIRFTPTFAYDVDPVAGSTAMPGFVELSALYRFYRVDSANINVSFSNKEAFPAECYISAVNSDPGANYNSAGAATYLAQRTSKSRVVGSLTGNSVVVLKDTQTTAGFGGSSNMHMGDLYSASTAGGAPANNWYWTVGIIGDAVLVSGVDARVQIDIDLEFYEVASPSA